MLDYTLAFLKDHGASSDDATSMLTMTSSSAEKRKKNNENSYDRIGVGVFLVIGKTTTN